MAKNELAAFGGKITQANRQNDAGIGSQNVTADDLSTPRLKLLQLISPEVKKHDAAYVEGAEAGMFLNTATKELSTSLFVMNIFFSKAWNIWDGDDNLVKTFDTEAEAKQYFTDENLDAKHNIVETHCHTLLVLDEKGNAKGAAQMYYSRSKIKVSKAWNTAINEYEKHGKARFAYIWQLVPVLEQNGKKQEYFNVNPTLFKVDGNAIEAPDALYDAARDELKALYGVVTEAAA